MVSKAERIAAVCDALSAGGHEDGERVLRREYPFAPGAVSKRQYGPFAVTRVFVRDGFIDRYSGEQLVFPPALRLLSAALPVAFPYHPNWKTTVTHPAYWEVSATVDHVVPVSRGGADEESNWVTTSMMHKMLVLLAMLNEDALPGEIGIERLASRSQCRLVGDPSEGTIVIADATKLATVVSRCVTAVLATATPSAATPPSAPVQMMRGAGFEAAMLRLGAQGLCMLSQTDTLNALNGQGSQGEIVMPAGLRTIGRDWFRAVEQDCLWVILSFREICGALSVTKIVGEGRVRPTKKAGVVAQNRDPWPGIAEAEYWLIGDEWLRFPRPYPFDAIRTRRQREYVTGLSKSQSAWVAVQIIDRQLRRELRLP